MKKCDICGAPLNVVPTEQLKDAYICGGKPDGPKHVFKLAYDTIEGELTTVLICCTPPDLGKKFPIDIAQLPS